MPSIQLHGPAFDYGSHLPLLWAIGRQLPIRRVVEYGGGDNSTRYLLDRAWFPELTALWTVEHHPEWAAKMRAQHADEPRHTLVELPEDEHPTWALPPRPLDLFFVDGPVPVRQALLHALPHDVPVLLHDLEDNYAWSRERYPHQITFKGPRGPSTGLLSHAPIHLVLPTLGMDLVAHIEDGRP